ncbi:histidine utilization repressor [Pseudomonas citronellolis]|uniref:Histidine utilization repressor n=1 Tax=Pseudomonas citronellolis TaxID=53408 RepID=A0AAW6P840_9PSED|nr:MULTISPECIES: histidine utilization repressor [Pseudomonas]MBB1610258.1 histidine utilization repressor [Pseudomonas sp. UMC76]MBB1639921.1 histidine utilization repressor [Pseudomonas sp. UME83]MDF3843713.1 histidine utilization repressor [Pseudomonas citronellolis]NTX90750.1 histidine utilization repressor [Pseudomonas sp. UMA643]NTY17205.1 histidine utilization repressor [Pseudomonas sp. UMC3103]
MTAKPSIPQALYRQAKSFVENKLRSGEWKPGDLIPSENRLVVELGMSRMTVNRALRELTAEGHLVRLSGVGTFVADRKPQSNLLMIANLADEVRARGHRYECRLVTLAREAASLPVAAALSLPTGSSVFHVTCVHCEEGVPVQLEDRYVNPELIPELLQQRFDDELQPSQYLLNVIAPDEMEHIVDAVLPNPAESELLELEGNEPCLVLMRRTWVRGKAVTFVRFVHPSSRYRLGSRLPVKAGHGAG